ncbi:hypothetical protein V6N11_001522 [Hibiscus sabdariffa]|uniref:Uncharacterized protein n=1 Tax=Hibiscus sabdariffa TaxID=183260 RepID=A0ABR2RZX9_9ROSI
MASASSGAACFLTAAYSPFFSSQVRLILSLKLRLLRKGPVRRSKKSLTTGGQRFFLRSYDGRKRIVPYLRTKFLTRWASQSENRRFVSYGLDRVMIRDS